MGLRAAVGAVGVLVLVAAGVYYVTEVPDRLAEDYVERAAPEHYDVHRAMLGMYASFRRTTFVSSELAAAKLEQAESPAELRYALFLSVRSLRSALFRARQTTLRARRVLEEADRDALLEVPSAPLLGGLGPLGEANRLAKLVKRHLPRATVLVRRYRALLNWALEEGLVVQRLGRGFIRELARAEEGARTPAEYAAGFERVAARLEADTEGYRRTGAPRELRRDKRATVALYRAIVREYRAVAAAIRARDVRRIEQSEQTLAAAQKRHERRARDSLTRLTRRSSYRRQMTRLRRLSEQIEQGFEELQE